MKKISNFKFTYFLLAAVFAFSLFAVQAFALEFYKQCPKCSVKVPKLEIASAQNGVEVNFCPSCGADLKGVEFKVKSDSEKTLENIKAKRRDLGELRQMSSREWYEKGETQEDKITRMACFVNALELEQTNEKAYNNLGVLYEEKNLVDEAVTCFRKAVEISPGYVKALNNLAKCLADLGKYDDSLDYYKKSLQAEDGNSVIHRNCADLLFKMKKYDESAVQYRRALELDPDGISGRIAAWKLDLVTKRFLKDKGAAAQPVMPPQPAPAAKGAK